MEIQKKVSKAAGVVGSMTLLSRVFGFLRDLVIAMMFGSSAAADAFFVAFRIPNVQRRLLGEGAVTAAFVPVFSEDLKGDRPKKAWEFTSQLFTILFYSLVVISGLIMIFAPQVIAILAPGFKENSEKFQLTIELTRWMAPFLICIGLSALCMGILNACNIFALPAAAPVMLNLCMIAAALLISPKMERPIFGLAIGVLIGGAMQLAFQLPAAIRKGLHFTLSIDWKHSGIVKFSKLMIPAIFGLAVYEINILVDTILASLLPGGSVSYLYYGNRLVQLPLGVFGVAMGVAILPTLSEQAAKQNISELRKTLAFGIRLILFVTVPATLGLIILRIPIINVLWERGEFTALSTEGTAIALLYYSIGLCAFSGVKVLAAGYYSLQDTKTPMKVGVYAMFLNIVLNLILMGPLQHGGLALATSLSAIFNYFALIYLLRNRLGLMGGRKILQSAFKLVYAAIPMGIIVYFLNEFLYDPRAALGYSLTVLLACVISGVVSFIVISHWLKNEEWVFLKKLRRN